MTEDRSVRKNPGEYGCRSLPAENFPGIQSAVCGKDDPLIPGKQDLFGNQETARPHWAVIVMIGVIALINDQSLSFIIRALVLIQKFIQPIQHRDILS